MNGLISAIKSFVLKNRPAYKDYLGNGKYDIKKLPEECVPDSVNDNIRTVQSTVDAVTKEYSVSLDENPRGFNLMETGLDRKLLYGGYTIQGSYDIPNGKVLKLHKVLKDAQGFIYATVLNDDYIESFVVGTGILLEDRTTIYRIGKDGIIIGSSTPNSTKKFKITIGDDARPTFTDTSNPNNTWTPGGSRYIINGHVWNYNGVNYIGTDETPDQLTTMYESGKDIFLDFNEERFKYTGSLFYTIMVMDEDNTGIKGAAITIIGSPMVPDVTWNCPYKGVCVFGVFQLNIQ